MKKTILDDGFQAYLTDGATFVGEAGIPMLMNINNAQIPKGLVPFSKIRTTLNKRQFVHFYQYDKEFSAVLTGTKKYLDILKLYDGVITPDCSMLINQSKCLQQTNTYMNRAVGYYLQKNGIPIIPNIRWSDEESFSFCFLGVNKGSIVSISTHGCIEKKAQKIIFKKGLKAMLNILQPSAVIVYGRMPDEIFSEFKNKTKFYQYPSEIEQVHKRMK